MASVLRGKASCAMHMARYTRFSGSLRLSRCAGTTPVRQQLDALAQEQDQETAAEATARPTHEIPGPRRYPGVGSLLTLLWKYSFDPGRLHKIWMQLAEDFGPIIRLKQPGMGNFIGISDPDACETLFRTTMENPLREALDSLKKIRMDAVDNYFEKKTGLLPENGEEWWRVRSRVQTTMLKPKNVADYLEKMDQVSLDFVERIAAMQAEYGEMPSDFQVELYKWALESVGLVALDRRLGCLVPNISPDSEPMRLISNVNEMFSAMNDTEMNVPYWKLFPTSSYKKLERSHNEFLEIADRNIRQTEAAFLSRDPSDRRDISVMEKLLLTPGLSRKDVVTLTLDMIFAGIDTTSHTIGFTLYLLARHPEVQARLQEELDNVLGDHQGPLTPKHLAQLSYLKAVIKESLRIFPLTIGVARTLDRDVVLSGYLVPKGWLVFTLSMLSGWDEKYFPQADKFIPERWLRHKPLGPIHPYASLPFGTGTRMCIGRRIAEQEMYTFLARAMHRFNVDFKYEDIKIAFCLVCKPSAPLKFTFSERK
ncbi:LOW QUALITY PROTEIN: probable cytochrome P450 49a1 [Panulirus ornatus]|uniref:LOW QUALITY PROTEIN: probable cytochrome P450 49a1 n=1 Tax=Panulirus ornatus TaxID=150431 RepID=UPI003A859129